MKLPSNKSATFRAVAVGAMTGPQQEAAIIAMTHDDKIFDCFDQTFMLRDGKLDKETSLRGETIVTPA